MSIESQNKQILNHLKSGKTITAIEALELFKCFRLASRIDELRRDHVISTTMVKRGGKRFAEYKYIQEK